MLTKLRRFIGKKFVELIASTTFMQNEMYYIHGLVSKPPKNSKILLIKAAQAQDNIALPLQNNNITLEDNDVVLTNGTASIYLKSDGTINIKAKEIKHEGKSIDKTHTHDFVYDKPADPSKAIQNAPGETQGVN